MVDVIEASTIVATVGVVIGIVYYFLEMKNQTRLMRTDALIRLYSTTNTQEVLDCYSKVLSLHVKNYEDYVEQYGSLLSEDPMHKAMFRIIGTYDFVGSLLFKKLIDLDLVNLVVGIDVTKMLYKRLKPILMGYRNETNEPGAFAGFDYLISELTRKEIQLKNATTRMLERSKLA